MHAANTFAVLDQALHYLAALLLKDPTQPWLADLVLRQAGAADRRELLAVFAVVRAVERAMNPFSSLELDLALQRVRAAVHAMLDLARG